MQCVHTNNTVHLMLTIPCTHANNCNVACPVVLKYEGLGDWTGQGLAIDKLGTILSGKEARTE